MRNETARVRPIAGCFIRAAPARDAPVLAAVRRGSLLARGGVRHEGWVSVLYRGQRGWISERLVRQEQRPTPAGRQPA